MFRWPGLWYTKTDDLRVKAMANTLEAFELGKEPPVALKYMCVYVYTYMNMYIWEVYLLSFNPRKQRHG